MKTKIHNIKRTVILGITVFCTVFSTLSANSTAYAAKVTTAGEYKVTKLKIPNSLSGNYVENVLVSKMGNKGLFATTKFEKMNSKGHIINDKKGNPVMEREKITWTDKGKIKRTKLANADEERYRLKGDNKGRIFYFFENKEGKITVDHLCVRNSKGKILNDIKISKIRKFHLKRKERNTNKNTGIIDFEVRGNYVDVLMKEMPKDHEGKCVISLQTFNWKTGELVKAYRLKYTFERIINGKLYGVASDNDSYNETKPIENGYYVYSKNGKKCLYQKEGQFSYHFDVADDKIVYYDWNKKGVYSLDMSNNTEPEVLLSTEDFPLLKRRSRWYYVFAMSEDEFYITYGDPEYAWRDIEAVYKFKKNW